MPIPVRQTPTIAAAIGQISRQVRSSSSDLEIGSDTSFFPSHDRLHIGLGIAEAWPTDYARVIQCPSPSI